MTSALPTFHLIGKHTVYFRSEFLGNYKRVEVREVRGTLRKYAQYASALEFYLIRPRERRERGFIQTHPSLVVVRGWGHPEPQTWKSGADGETQEAAHHSFSPEWANDFDAMLRTSVKESDIVADYRGHDPHAALSA